MERNIVKNIKKEELIEKIAEYIKKCSKNIKDNSLNVPIKHENWFCGCGANSKWDCSIIKFDGTEYWFKEKEINDEEFSRIMAKAFEKANCLGELVTRNVSNSWGYYSRSYDRFEKLILYKSPCKEFGKLANMIKKYTDTDIDFNKIYSVNLFGKRGHYGESGKKYYLGHDEKSCQDMIDFIKSTKTSKDILKVEYTIDDDIDTDYSIRYETECYGTRYAYLEVSVETPKGKVKGLKQVA